MEKVDRVKHIDDLGRIIIPKDIRKRMGLKEGDAMRFVTFRSSIILSKYEGKEE